MRIPALVLVLAAAACGDDASTAKDAAVVPHDTQQPNADAPPLAACTPVSGTTISVRQVGATIQNASILLATSPPNDGRLFLVLQDGRIKIMENEVLKTGDFLDLSNTNLLASQPQGERGLLGMAFHPNYAVNRQFFVYYTTGSADVVARYYVSETDLNKADPTGEIVLSIPDFASNHNGGMIEFGKDGYLYIGTGDGGGGGDPNRNGQAVNRAGQVEPLLGKILRIDVNTTMGVKNYGIPADNPFATSGGEPEIYVIGLRNPWRWSFDRMTGDMWIGDVGQGPATAPTAGGIEELDVLTAGNIAGKNLGWSMYEASSCLGNYTCSTTGKFMPQIERTRNQDGWRAIVGGEVYRGTCYPDIVGNYYFTDNTAHPLTQARLESNGTVTATDLPGTWPDGPASIHGDARGELYLTTTNGRVYHIEAGP